MVDFFGRRARNELLRLHNSYNNKIIMSQSVYDALVSNTINLRKLVEEGWIPKKNYKKVFTFTDGKNSVKEESIFPKHASTLGCGLIIFNDISDKGDLD